jgi:acyl carrier protein
MSENERRLLRCFASVFPGLSPDDIRVAGREMTGSWDSLSAVTLAAVIQEEFRVEIDPQVLLDLDSFEAFRVYLRGLNPAGEQTVP